MLYDNGLDVAHLSLTSALARPRQQMLLLSYPIGTMARKERKEERAKHVPTNLSMVN